MTNIADVAAADTDMIITTIMTRSAAAVTTTSITITTMRSAAAATTTSTIMSTARLAVSSPTPGQRIISPSSENGIGSRSGNTVSVCAISIRPSLPLFPFILAKTTQNNFLFHGRISLQTLHRHQVHIVERKLGEFGDHTLDEDSRFGGVDTA